MCQWSKLMYHYGFVALSVRMCVAGANKVEGTMSYCLGTNEILTSKHDIAALNVKRGHFIETAILVIGQFQKISIPNNGWLPCFNPPLPSEIP